MKLHAGAHYLFREDGSLFFYCADTAWELFHKLTYEEACHFIDDRAAKGFNVLQSVAVAELDGLHTPAYEGGLLPFAHLPDLTPCAEYFDHVQRVIEYANSRGLFIALVPMWGSYLIPNAAWGGKVKPLFDAASAARFVSYLAGRFQDLNLIWLLGGDRSYVTAEHREIIKAMAQAIRAVSGDRQLISAHTQGGRSLWDMLQQPDYLDFITWQSGHMGACYPSWRSIGADYARLPLPVLDAEPCYESHPVMNEYSFSRSDCGSRFTDREVRRSSWWSVFAGGAGITYGCYAVWQMHREKDELKEIPESAASAYKNDRIPFYHRSLNFPGAFQIPILKRFMEHLPHADCLQPQDSLILGGGDDDAGHVGALTNTRGEFIAVYVPDGRSVTVDISSLGCAAGYPGFALYWFDPRYEIYNYLGDDNSESQFIRLTPPRIGGDFVLLIVRKDVPFNPAEF